MVSTRQMTIGNNGSGENYQPPAESSSKCTRNSAPVYIAGFSGSMRCSKTFSTPVQSIHFLDLPQEIIEKIFSYLKFKNICQLRLVCRTIDRICGQMLNSTFLRLQNQMLTRFQDIKSKMPRRESARRSHYLAGESDIIETLHMRLTLLQMSFGKHIERKHCCFFPGEILDEVYHILHYVKVTPKLDVPYKVTDELFDLSTMAMEYFKEKIEPYLPEIAYFSADFLNFSGSFPNSTTLSPEVSKDSGHASTDELEGDDLVETIPQSNMVLRKRIRKIKQGMKRYNSQLSLLRQDLRSCKRKTCEQQRQISEQQKQLTDQQKQTLEYATRLDEYDKKNEEISRKFSALLQELNKCKTELQYWRCKSPAMPPSCHQCGASIPQSTDELQPLISQGLEPDNNGFVKMLEQEVSLDFNPAIPQIHSGPLQIIMPCKDDNNIIEVASDQKIVHSHDEQNTASEHVKNNKRRSEEAKEDRPTKKTRRLYKIRCKRNKI